MEARIVPGPRPSTLDAAIAAEQRGMGPLASKGFVRGYMRAVGFPIGEPTSKREGAWQAEGARWAEEEIARRKAVAGERQP